MSGGASKEGNSIDVMEVGSNHQSGSNPNPSTRSPFSSSSGVSFNQKVCRICVVTGTGIIAAIVPNLGDLIALIGAVSGSMLAVIIPAMIDLNCPRVYEVGGGGDGISLFGKQMRQYEKYFNYFLIVIGTIMGIWGTTMAVQATLSNL
jgi:amino acid permease